MMLKAFNSRPHKEVDGFTFLSTGFRNFFQFTTSQGGRRFSVVQNPLSDVPFNSRPHKEVDLVMGYILEQMQRPFNSRPHKEVDCMSLLYSLARSYLSIHDLTRRSTVLEERDFPKRTPFNSRPHKEVDSMFRDDLEYKTPFNSRPHKEVDGIGRIWYRYSDLSIHDLTRRSTRFAVL